MIRRYPIYKKKAILVILILVLTFDCTILNMSIINISNFHYIKNRESNLNQRTKIKELDEIYQDKTILDSSIDELWWNESYRYRVEIQLEEPGYFNRTNEPVDIYLTFQSKVCHNDTIRVVERNIKEIPSQVWNITQYDATYIKSAMITFLANVNESETVSYYVYYSDNNDEGKIQNPKQRYMSESGFTSILDDLEGKLSIKTTEFNLELKEGMGIYDFTKDGVNFHTDESLAPWMKAAKVDTKIYHPDPDQGGAIGQWLVVGTFDYFNPDWDHPITATKYHIDVTRHYFEGDNATGGDAVGFLDESNQWEKVDFRDFNAYNQDWGTSDFHGYCDLNTYFSPTASTSGNPEYVAMYATCYIKSPIDLNDVYLKVGSDDGIKIFRDGQEIHYNHIMRSPAPDREAVGPMDFEAGRWYCFIVLIEEGTGQTGFHFRFSTNPTLYGITPENDPGAINNLDIALKPPIPLIETISKITDNQIGPIFSRYQITWEDDEDMRTSDIITIYNDYNLWKCERTFWWTSEQQNLNFSIINTIYEDSINFFDRYFYDNIWEPTPGLSNPTASPENYTVLWDADSETNLKSLGIFLSSVENGGSLTIDELYWGIDYDSSTQIINLRPGNQTDLDNGIGGPSNYLEITFWEYIDDNVGVDSIYQANVTFAGIFNSLQHPLIKKIKSVEIQMYFNLTVNLTDVDGYNVKDAMVYIYNATSKKFITNQTTDENGLTTFVYLLRYNYTINATFQKYDKPEFLIFANKIVSLNKSITIVLSYCNLTSINLELRERNYPHELIKGANVSFYYKSLVSSNILIGSEISDAFGKVTFVWKNVSCSIANISVSVFISDIRYSLNKTGIESAYILNYTFENRIEDIIGVAINSDDSEPEQVDDTTTNEEDKSGDKSKINYFDIIIIIIIIIAVVSTIIIIYYIKIIQFKLRQRKY